MSPVDGLRADALRAALGDQLIGNHIIVLEETTSTNDVVLQLASENEEGLAVFAERQTAGRGQYGSRWESAAHKGLWFSVLLRPKISPEDSPRLTAWAAQAVAATLRQHCSLGATVKPPNDVYVGAQKIAGVLLELRAVPGSPHLGILGIGINVNQSASDFTEELRERAGSLAVLTGKHIDRHALAVAVLRQLDQTYSARTV